jgi:O-antigen/teichoic acid export membrane protein
MPEVSDNRRIAKNTLMLYFRQILILLVNLYAVRVVLNTLGAEDYGIYTVVAGVITMFSSLSGSISSASQRYFAFEIGRGNYEQLKKIFSICLTIYILIGVVIVLLAETAGFWFMNHKLVIPENRMNAARWIYQFALVSFLLTMITIPYMASIIAHEDMTIYAYISIVEAVLKLCIIFFLRLFSIDKLVLYGILLCVVTFINTTIYRTICIKKYKECRFIFYFNYKSFRQLINFIGWDMLVNISWVLKKQGVDVLLNMFFGPVMNTARSIADRIDNTINSFVYNLTMAMGPSIVKTCAAKKYDDMFVLVFRNAKFGYFLLLIISMPIIWELPYILELWLKNIPEYTVIFARLILLNILVGSITRPLEVAVKATGDIKSFGILQSSIIFLNLPISYIILKIGFLPYYVMFVSLCLSIVGLIVQLLITRRILHFPVGKFIIEIILRVFIVSVVALLVSSMISNFNLLYIKIKIIRLFCFSIISIGSTLIIIYFFGLTKYEQIGIRKLVYTKIKNK